MHDIHISADITFLQFIVHSTVADGKF